MKHGSAQTPTSTGHRGSSDHRLALGHQGAPASKGKCPQDTESRAPPPSLSVTRLKSTTELLHQGGGLLFLRTKCRHHSTPSRRVVDGNAFLASARLLLS